MEQQPTSQKYMLQIPPPNKEEFKESYRQAEQARALLSVLKEAGKLEFNVSQLPDSTSKLLLLPRLITPNEDFYYGYNSISTYLKITFG